MRRHGSGVGLALVGNDDPPLPRNLLGQRHLRRACRFGTMFTPGLAIGFLASVLVQETACAACHGTDLNGVAGLPDMPSGVALRLIGGRGTLASANPVVTVESYWPYATTLFGYIRRAMPFSTPGSLNNDEVYAATAYILAEGKIIDKTTVIDAETLPKVQMPNRDGFIPDPRPEMFK